MLVEQMTRKTKPPLPAVWVCEHMSSDDLTRPAIEQDEHKLCLIQDVGRSLF